ncbi:hypothetical protein OJ998_40595 [Solirubrobacter taibaiensis]|nr:hypothetical protein [Solirubrobacter taibaiensis]
MFQEAAVLKNAVVTEADTVMVTVIVVVMDAAVAMDVIVTVTVMDVIVTETVIAIVMVVVVVVEVKVKVALVLQMDAAKENIIAVHKLNKKRECPLRAFSFFYFYNCAYYIIVMIEKGLLYACKAWLRCDECTFEECISISNDDVCTVSEIR